MNELSNSQFRFPKEHTAMARVFGKLIEPVSS